MTVSLPIALNDLDAVGGSGVHAHGPQDFVVYVDELNVEHLLVVVGWQGGSHPTCPFPPTHCVDVWTMVEGSEVAFIVDPITLLPIPICRQGDAASCGDTTTGTPFIFEEVE